MNRQSLDRSAACDVAGLTAKGRMSSQTMERWQDKSRDVRTSGGGKKGNKSRVLSRCIHAADELRFSASRCPTFGNSTSRGLSGR